jgi:serine protease inhibitor
VQAKHGTDVFLSPYGIARALGMLLNGAEPGGASERELRALSFGGATTPLATLNASLKQLSAALAVEPSDNLAVADANSVWVAPRYTLQQRCANALRAAFAAHSAPLTGAAAVNDWVRAATRGKISSIVNEAAVREVRSSCWEEARCRAALLIVCPRASPERAAHAAAAPPARAPTPLAASPAAHTHAPAAPPEPPYCSARRQATLILVNAIYFKGMWLHPFKK